MQGCVRECARVPFVLIGNEGGGKAARALVLCARVCGVARALSPATMSAIHRLASSGVTVTLHGWLGHSSPSRQRISSHLKAPGTQEPSGAGSR